MWSRSGGVMLFQNIVAWLKWSSNDCGPLADDGALHRPGDVRPCPASPAWNGQPPPSELGK